MGLHFSRENYDKTKYEDFCPLRIATLYADIDESINKKTKIDTIVEYFMKKYHGYKLDVLCLQGIRNYRIMKEIITAFKERIEKYNDTNKHGYNTAIYLEFYPDITTQNSLDNNIINTYWSTNDGVNYYDKLIITRHNILQTADVHIGSNRKDIIYRNINLMTNTKVTGSDSDEILDMYKYVQVVNLNVDGTFVSIYNIDLEYDTLGISNTKERKRQIKQLKRIIEENRKRSLLDEVRQFVHGDNTFIACNRNIHIVVGAFHINEVKNNELSTEYLKMCNTLNGIDIHRWISLLRKDIKFYETNVRFTKDTFTILVSPNISDMFNNRNDEKSNMSINVKSQKLFEEHKLVIINSTVTKNIVDMNKFTNYPEDTIFMLYIPNIKHKYHNQLRIRKDKNTVFRRKSSTASIYSNTSRFMNQAELDAINSNNDIFNNKKETEMQEINSSVTTEKDEKN